VTQSLLLGWVLEPVPTVALLAGGTGYVLAARAVSRSRPERPWPALRTAFFLAGTVAVAVAVLGPPGAFDDTFFFAHMTQHVLLTMVAAPLLVLGDPVLLALRAAPRDVRRHRLVPFLRSRPVRLLMRPGLGWGLFVTVMVLSHVPAVYDYAVEHPLVHDYVEHPLYLGSALVFFYPLLAPTPGPHRVRSGVRVLSMFTVMIPMTLTGFFIYVAPRPAYPYYAHVARPFGPGALADQQLAGALMWSTAMVLSALWLCLTGARFLAEEAARSRRADRTAAAGLRTLPERSGEEWAT
jgi:putative copper resistance protein D